MWRRIKCQGVLARVLITLARTLQNPRKSPTSVLPCTGRVPREHAGKRCFRLFCNDFSQPQLPGTRFVFLGCKFFGTKSWKTKHLDACTVYLPLGLYNIKGRGLGDELGQGFDIVLGARAPNGQSEKPQKLYVRHNVGFSTQCAQSGTRLHRPCVFYLKTKQTQRSSIIAKVPQACQA